MSGDWGKETVVLVQIDIPFCTREYGDAFFSPTGGCAAVLGSSGTRKCYQSRVTCQDAANFNPGTLTLTFGREEQSALAKQYGYVIPSLVSVDTTPGAINLAAMDRSAAALGQREIVSLAFKDHKHSDLLVDKYRLERKTGAAASGSPSETFDPYERGTFWGKWLARNPYHQGYALRVYEGFMGEALADMRVRHYVVDRVEGPSDGQVRVVAKDIFSLIEAKKAVAPVASTGELAANITAVATSAALSPAGIGNEEYPASGHAAIGEEVIAFTRSGDTLTLTRAQFGTTAAAHDQEDLVQLVLTYTTQLAHNVVWDLLVNYTALGNPGSPTGSDYIDKAEWDSLAENIDDVYTARIAKPTPVLELVGELCEQAGFTLIPDISTGMVEFAPLRAGTVDPTVDDGDWILEDPQIKTKRQDAKRASQVWVYYGQINPTKDLDEKTNYRSRVVSVDLDAEDDDQYGTAAIREVFSRWIPQFGRSQATSCGDRILAMFRDPPLEATFAIHASRDGELNLGHYFYLETSEVQDESGAVEAVAMAPVQLHRSENEIGITAQAVTFGEDVESGVRTIFIENDSYNLNLRTVHDSLYAAPTEGSPGTVIEFIILVGVEVGSTSTSEYALRTGTWPATANVSLEIRGRIQGKGGAGGAGGNGSNPPSSLAGSAGANGGPALLVESFIVINNIAGQIYSGGGGGGGGGASVDALTPWVLVGGGGAGGSGTDGGAGGPLSGASQGHTVEATAGGTGSADAGGSVGAGALRGGIQSGDGGAGGGPGQDGSAGETPVTVGVDGAGGAGGSKGVAISGDSLVLWAGSPAGDRGDVRGTIS